MSSVITNIVETVYRARGSQAIQESRAVAQGIGRIGTSVNEATRLSERFNNQWRAIGTTLRYSIAGGTVFGIANLVTQLSQVQEQLGLISAIGSTTGGIIQGRSLDQLFTQARTGAVDAITPVKDYNDAIINLLSTVQNLPQDQITPIVTQISQAAKLAQISSEDATKAFTTMNVAFGRPTNLKNVRQMSQEFFTLTQEAPGGVAAGQQIVGQLGQLAQVTRVAGGTPEDMFALLLSTLRSGIPPAQAGRGLQFLVQTLGLPGSQSPASRQALADVGISTSTGNMSLQERLGRVFAHARRLGVRGNLNALNGMDDQTMADMGITDDTALNSGTLNQFGLSGAGVQYLGTVFRRIHSLRTALALMGQINTGQAQSDIKTFHDEAQGHVDQVHDIAQAWRRFSDQAQLQRAAVAINSMGLQVAQIFAPVLNRAARGVVGIEHAANSHHGITRDIILGGGASLAGLGLVRMLRGGGLGSGIARGEAIRDLSATGLGASPEHAMYVIVVGNLFNPGGTKIPGGGGGGSIQDRATRLGKLGVAARFLARTPEIGAVVGGTYLVATEHGRQILRRPITNVPGGLNQSELIQRGMRSDPRIARFINTVRNAKYGSIDPRSFQEYQGYMSGNISAQQLSNYLGRADVYMTIDVNRDGKTTRKRVHIPMTLNQNGSHPSSRGKVAAKNG